LDDKDFLHSLFSQCSMSLNNTTITQANELYNYRSFLETILTYSSGAAATPLTNAFWYLDNGNMLPCDLTAADSPNKSFVTRWNLLKQSQETEIYGRIDTDIRNVS
jgi:hypothetical protein